MDGVQREQVARPAQQAVSSKVAWWSVFVFTIALMLNFVDRQIITLLITPIKADLGLSDSEIGLLLGTVFVVFNIAVGIPISRLIDRGRRKWILSAGIATWSVMTAACGMAQNFWQLAIARMGVGVGDSCNGPATFSLLMDMFDRRRIGRALAVLNLGASAGAGLALLIGATVIAQLNEVGNVELPGGTILRPWQMTFILVGLPGVLWALVVLFTVPEPPRRGECGGEAPVIPSLAGVLRFVFEWRSAYGTLVMSTGCGAMMSFGMNVWAPSLFERKFGWEPGVPGFYIGTILLIAAPVGGLIGGYLSDKLSAKGVEDAPARVYLWSAVGAFPFAVCVPLMPTASLALAMMFGSLFFGAVGTTPGTLAVQVITPGRMRGTIATLYIAVFSLLGYGIGPLLVALSTDYLFGGPENLPKSMVLVAAVLGAVSIIFSKLALAPYRRAAAVAAAREGLA